MRLTHTHTHTRLGRVAYYLSVSEQTALFPPHTSAMAHRNEIITAVQFLCSCSSSVLGSFDRDLNETVAIRVKCSY